MTRVREPQPYLQSSPPLLWIASREGRRTGLPREGRNPRNTVHTVLVAFRSLPDLAQSQRSTHLLFRAKASPGPENSDSHALPLWCAWNGSRPSQDRTVLFPARFAPRLPVSLSGVSPRIRSPVRENGTS